MDFFEILGYVASFIVLISIAVKNVKRFRWINLCGASSFVVYGLSIGAYPIAAMNSIIVFLDIYFLYQIYNRKDYFDINEELEGHEFFIKRFFDFYGDEIKRYFPEFSFDQITSPKLILVSRNINPVGLFVYEKDLDSRSIIIHLDFACPDYRDTKNFFYLLQEKIEDFKREGHVRFVSKSSSPDHIKYLERVGFKRSISGDRYELPL
ncbi:MAG: hypothetical protein KAG61_07540 [Bacteriovoracaceae bacterium]|nr:hypothetical protein [Bacteriovoracaceae bacterium]